MANLFYDFSKFIIPSLFAVYALVSLFVLPGYFKKRTGGKDTLSFIFMFLIHLSGYAVMTLQNMNFFYLAFFAVQELVFVGILNLYRIFYPGFNRPLLNHIFTMISIGMIMLTRLSESKAIKQFIIICISFALSAFIPFLIRKLKLLEKMTWVYGSAGVILLTLVYVLGSVTNGSKLGFSVLGVSFQPSEFVKILFILFLGAILSEGADFFHIALATVVALLNVGLLVVSKDLGSAAIFLVCYLVVVFVASGKLRYFLSGLALSAAGGLLAYKLFYHVKVRIISWLDPFSDITGKGYQLSQSLFAISTGGWFGMGLCQGTPDTIPYVEQDFIFSAITEELGVVFSLCFVITCICIFLHGMSIAVHVHNKFFKYISLGISITYIFQVFLTIGGGTRFIPLTGVTLPFVSYGGSSIMATIIMFSLLQGISITASAQAGLVEELEEEYEESMEEITESFPDDREIEDADVYYLRNEDLIGLPDDYRIGVNLKSR